MAARSNSSVYVGNLDEKVSDRVLYDILIQAGRVVDLHIPRDRETSKPKGYAFAEYENEEVAQYAVKLFSGLVTLHNRTLKFAVSGQDKPSASSSSGINSSSHMPYKSRSHHIPGYSAPTEISPYSQLSTPCRFSSHPDSYVEAPVYHGVSNQSNGYGSHWGSHNNDHYQRDYGTTLDSISRSRSGRYDSSYPVSYPSYESLN